MKERVKEKVNIFCKLSIIHVCLMKGMCSIEYGS